MKKKVKVGLVGVGKMGELHLKKLLFMDDVEVVGFLDTHSERASYIAEKYGVTYYSDLDDLFSKIEALFIVSSTESHFNLVEKAMEYELSLFVEKPLAQSFIETEKLLDLCALKGILLQVGFLERFRWQCMRPSFIKLPVHITCKRLNMHPPRHESSILSDLLIHDVDLVCSLVASSKYFLEKIKFLNNQVSCVMRFEDGSLAHFDASYVSPKMERSLYLTSENYQGHFNFLSNEVIERYWDENQWRENNRKVNIDPLWEQDRHFIHCVRNNMLPLISLDEIFRVHKLIDEVEKSVWQKTPVETFL